MATPGRQPAPGHPPCRGVRLLDMAIALGTLAIGAAQHPARVPRPSSDGAIEFAVSADASLVRRLAGDLAAGGSLTLIPHDVATVAILQVDPPAIDRPGAASPKARGNHP